MNHTKDNGSASPKSQPVQTITQLDYIKTLPVMSSGWQRMMYGYSCAFSFYEGTLSCTWIPDLPHEQVLSCIFESRNYKSAKYLFTTDIATVLEISVPPKGGNS